MSLVRLCPHMVACPGGGCYMTPCDECGALCPNSSWTPEYEASERRQMVVELERALRDSRKRERLYLVWRAESEVVA